MFKKLILCSFVIFSNCAWAQTNAENISPQSSSTELDILKKRIQDLEEIQNENSEILKKQLGDQHFDQNSRGYIELKFGQSSFSPDDIEDANDETFSDMDGSHWKNFEYATILEFEIGKTILATNSIKHEIGIGYQNLRSKIDAAYTPSGGGAEVTVYETVSIHTLFARYAMLFKATKNGRFFVGPGATIGYSPVSKILIEVEQGNQGTQVSAESTSYLLEFFGKAKFDISRYFSIIAISGYRIQEANNLRLNAAELVNVKTKVDLDASGFFNMIGLAVAF